MNFFAHPTREYLRQNQTAVSLSSRAGECGNRKSDRILAFRNIFMLDCSQYQTSSQLQRDSTNEVVPNTCCAKATNVNEE
ncbi:hypothetical protein [Nostoc commune]|uniref:hypothetical protein n=1 Tax=Nostoc commune TaxID=1178 RepID=UPI002073251B|nr:hypothetical protein [Nostoc commune]